MGDLQCIRVVLAALKKTFGVIVLACLMSTAVCAQQGHVERSHIFGAGTPGVNTFFLKNTVHKMVCTPNGDHIIIGQTLGVDFPVTNGSTYGGGVSDLFITRFDSNDNMVYSTYWGGDDNEGVANILDIVEDNGKIYVSGLTLSTNFPTTIGNYSGPGAFVLELNQDATVASAMVIDDGFLETAPGVLTPIGIPQYGNGTIYVSGRVADDVGYPSTDGSTPSGDLSIRLSAYETDGTLKFRTYFGGNGTDSTYQMKLADGSVYIAGSTTSTDLPVTNGSVLISNPAIPSSKSDGFLVAFDGQTGVKTMATYFGGMEFETLPTFGEIINGKVYLNVSVRAPFFPTEVLDYPITTGNYPPGPFSISHINFLSAFDGVTGTLEYSSYVPFYSGSITYFEERNSILYASSIWMDLDANGLPTSQTTLTEASTQANLTRCLFAIGDRGPLLGIDPVAKTYTQLDFGSQPNRMETASFCKENGKLFVAGTSFQEILQDNPFLATDNNAPTRVLPSRIGTDVIFMNFDLCPTFPSDHTVTPASQTICQNATGALLNGNELRISGDDLPLLYDSRGIPTQQAGIPVFGYQWQIADTATGPWTDIPGATFEDYLPSEQTIDKYYRRKVLDSPCCSNSTDNISNVVEVLVTADTTQQIDAGGILYACSGQPIQLGGNPTVISGGVAPFTYTWDNLALLDDASETTANPVATVSDTTVFTLTVTDANGCQSIDQVVVNVPSANPIPNISTCSGNPIVVGNLPPQGATNVAYSWTFADDSPVNDGSLSCTDCAQPIASVLTTTDYKIGVTLNSGTPYQCSFTQLVTVRYVAPPLTPDFAGADLVLCKGDSGTLGSPPESGWTYNWAPVNYLDDTTSPQPTLDFGRATPSPNPYTFYVTATKDGCSFTDAVTVSVIEPYITDEVSPVCIASNGSGYSTTFGQPDQTPDVNETYLWEIVGGGTATISGPNDRSTVAISGPNDATTSTLRLTVSLNGVDCVEEIEVTSTCTPCDVDIVVESDFGCPSTQGGNELSLQAELLIPSSANLSNYTFRWSPQQGLSNYDQRRVSVIDNVERTYTVTVTDIRNGNFCTQDVVVNNPAWSAPNFIVPFNAITVCPSDPVISIGQPPVTGYSYSWFLEQLGTVFSTDSNPQVDPSGLTEATNTFTVTVTDDATGCTTRDQVIVNLADLNVDAGADIWVCGDAIVRLGTPAVAGYTYSWEPSTANFQNGTGPNDARPEILFASTFDQTFTLTATSPEGCVVVDNIQVRYTGDADNALGLFPNPTICSGERQEIGLPALNQVNYVWSVVSGDNTSLPIAERTTAQPQVAPTATTIYRLLADFPGDCNDPIERLVTVTVLDDTFSMTDENYCPFPAGNTVTIGDDPSIPTGANYTYAWSGQGISGTTTRTVDVSPSSETQYRLTVTNTTTGCEHSETVTVTPQTDLPNVGQTERTVCFGQSAILGSSSNPLHNPPNTIVSWSPATNLDNPTAIAPIFTPVTTGTFTYTLSITENGCENQNTVTIRVVDPPALPNMAPITVCSGSSTVIGVDALPGMTYSWSPQTNLDQPNSARTLVTAVTENIDYTLTVVDSNTGCSTQKSVHVGVSPNTGPTVTIPDLELCLNDSARPLVPNITPPDTGNDYSFQWEVVSGETFTSIDNVLTASPSISPSDVGATQYRLSVTDLNTGCSTVAEATATVTPIASIVNPGSIETCESTYRLPLISGFNLNPLITYYDGPNGTGNTYAPGALVSSDITLYIYDASPVNCSNEERFTITFNTTPTLSLVDLSCAANELTYDIDFISNGSVIAESSPAGTPLTVTGNRIANVPAGVDVLLRATNGDCVNELLVSAPNCATFDQCRPTELPLVYTGVIANGTDRIITSGEAIRVNADATLTGDLTLTGGLLHIADGATLTITGNLDLQGGELFLTECAVLNVGATFNCSGGTVKAYCDTFDPEAGETLVESPSMYSTSDGDYTPVSFSSKSGTTCRVDAFACPDVGDYGDALNLGDALHEVPIQAILYLGTIGPDEENNTLNSIAADGDDANGSLDDEDGIADFPRLNSFMTSYSVTAEVTNVANSTVTLVGWIDFDLSGTFDPDEAALLSGNLQGPQVLNWNGAIPNDITPGTAYARFRISSDPLTAIDASSAASNGEVEDYLIPILPGNTVIAKNDINQTPQNRPVSGTILTNDKDPENDQLSILTIMGLDASGIPLTIPIDGSPVRIYDPNGLEAGTITFMNDGSYTFVPTATFFGPVTLYYDLVDNQVNQAMDSATLVIKVIPDLVPLGNNPPIAQDDTVTMEQGETARGLVLTNDSDPDTDELRLNGTTGWDANGNSVDLTEVFTDIYDVNGTLAGQARLLPSGAIEFTASPVYTGEVALFYSIADVAGLEDSAVLVFSVEPRDGTDNDTYANDDANNAPIGASQMGNILTNDYDPEGDLQIVTHATDADGNTIVLGVETHLPNGGTFTLDPNGEYTYVPPIDFFGTETITYTVCDDVTTDPPGRSCESATLYLTNLFQPAPSLLLVKTAEEPMVLTSGSTLDTDGYLVRYVLNVTNSGELFLTDVSLVDDLNNTFSAPMSFEVSPLNAIVTSSAGNPISLNGSYNGDTDIELLAAGTTLAPGEGFEFTLEVNVAVNCDFSTVTNIAQASANASNNQSVTVWSNSTDASLASVSFAESALFIPEGFSPNGDGNHDTFQIEKPSCMELTLECYNRWGNQVWTSNGDNYQNNWDGTANTGLHLGEQLPDGTYYWIMKITDPTGENRNRSGYVTLIR